MVVLLEDGDEVSTGVVTGDAPAQSQRSDDAAAPTALRASSMRPRPAERAYPRQQRRTSSACDSWSIASSCAPPSVLA